MLEVLSKTNNKYTHQKFDIFTQNPSQKSAYKFKIDHKITLTFSPLTANKESKYFSSSVL